MAQQQKAKSAVILLSGGLDSATVAAIAKADGYHVHALSFRYGQSHDAELAAAIALARSLQLDEHRIMDIDLAAFGGSALTDPSVPIPLDRNHGSIPNEIPVTYVPARNTIFLSFALGLAEVVEADEIHIGVNALDYSGYPDCRPDYIAAFSEVARLATRIGVEGKPPRIMTPLIDLNKAQIIGRGSELGLDYAKTVSCYQADVHGRACGRCDACVLRKKGFAEAGLADPTRYIPT